MNLIVVPFHDWRKSQKEGFRTRDVHFISALNENPTVERTLVINRPTTQLELLYKGNTKAIQGKLIHNHKNFTLTQVRENLFVVDCLSNDFFGQLLRKHLWFIDEYNNKNYIEFIETCKKQLFMENNILITQNIFAYKLIKSINAKFKVFDAWDNFLKFPAYQRIKNNLNRGYEVLAKEASLWTTNSKENSLFFKSKFKPHQIFLIKNGVKSDFLPKTNIKPKELSSIKRPIMGFGGKISYLLDVDLINFITQDNPKATFVFIGQIIDKHIYKRIVKRKNVFFLGDKKYSEYPNYVANFDVCIVPYNVKEKQHGGDSMKAYEYLLTGKKVVGTVGNGLEDLEEYLFLAENKVEFSRELKNLKNNKKRFDAKEFSWKKRAEDFIQLLKNEQAI